MRVTRETLSVAALIVGAMLLAVAVSAVVGAVTYAGWIEPGSRPCHESEGCCP